MKKTLIFAGLIATVCFTSCNNNEKEKVQTKVVETTVKKTKQDMKSFISMFEIPATDISRAIEFYQEVLDINIEKMNIPEMQMGIFPYEGQMVSGVIIKGEGYQPSSEGITIYLNGGDNLQIILDKVEKSGGKIIVTKTLHGDESGYFAIFIDSEGNKIGLHSPN